MSRGPLARSGNLLSQAHAGESGGGPKGLVRHPYFSPRRKAGTPSSDLRYQVARPSGPGARTAPQKPVGPGGPSRCERLPDFGSPNTSSPALGGGQRDDRLAAAALRVLTMPALGPAYITVQRPKTGACTQPSRYFFAPF